ncbi:MAG: N(4)-(beta-N-acetylglucosaminyl)-L-asparaginase [Pirellulales bacterium]
MQRRDWIGTTSAMIASGLLAQRAVAANAVSPLFIATWNFGLPACEKSLKILEQTGSVLDAVEQGIQVAEADPDVDSVGLGGAPNAAGIVQLDACFMDGKTHRAGSVAGLEDYPHPISVARRVMEKTKHVLLVGKGAGDFAAEQGFAKAELLTPVQKKKWEEWKKQKAADARRARSDVQLAASEPPPNHDTIALVGMDEAGHIAGGCSTSGLAYKLPGRVGDSPILGSGLYVDGDVGAAGATGIGENVMRFCGTFQIVELMRSGLSPTDACRTAIERIAKRDGRPISELHINFLAIDKQGRWGGAGTDESFRIAVVTNGSARLEKALLVT